MGCFLNEVRGGFRLEHGSRAMENKQQPRLNFSHIIILLIQVEENLEDILQNLLLSLSFSLKIVSESRVEREGVYVSQDDNFHPVFQFHLPFSFRCHLDEPGKL